MCPACKTGVLAFIGQLGHLLHARCRNCGATCSAPAIDQDLDDVPPEWSTT